MKEYVTLSHRDKEERQSGEISYGLFLVDNQYQIFEEKTNNLFRKIFRN